MMNKQIISFFFVVLGVWMVSLTVFAQESSGRDKFQRDHKFQGVVNVGTGTGWYMVAPYEKNDPEKACGYDENNEAEPVCTGRSTWYMDFLGGFGVRPGLELLFMYRQGVETASLGNPQLRRMGGGFKFYKPADTLVKMGFGVILLGDFSKRTEGSEENGDFVIHIPISLQVDVVRWFGVYGQIAPNISFVSEFRFDINFGFGIQGRFP
ncbi:MAG: hypothetical protein JXX29_21980 [Deltaproteobacteria bacterium]|nr:hypothetical protein [Deltaproteobacteria bacterium]MBN2674365.1 hypothetical protein [Deltaproteobacteria bacterium]